MPLIEVHIDDPRLDAYRHLKHTNATRWDGTFVVEGDKLARRVIDCGAEIESLLVGRRYAEKYGNLAPDGVSIFVVEDAQVEEIVGFSFHRGVLAHARRPKPVSLAEFLESIENRATLVVAPDLQDPENLGTLIRTSLALGVQGAILGSGTADPYSRRVLRTSMGAVLKLPLVHSNDLPRDLRILRATGFETVATVTDAGAEPLDVFVRPDRLAILFGNEGHGLSPELVAGCDRRVTIGMQPGVDSFNAAIAAGIVLYWLK